MAADGIFITSFVVFPCGAGILSTWYTGSVVATHRFNILQHVGSYLPDQGLNWGPQHHRADSQPLEHSGNPLEIFLMVVTEDALSHIPWAEVRDAVNPPARHKKVLQKGINISHMSTVSVLSGAVWRHTLLTAWAGSHVSLK